MAKKIKLSPTQRQALWNIQRDGGLILTLGSDVESPYTTRAGRTVNIRTVQVLIQAGELQAEDSGLLGEKPTAWQVSRPVSQSL